MQLSEHEMRTLIVAEASSIAQGCQPWVGNHPSRGDLLSLVARLKEFIEALPVDPAQA